MIGDGCSAPSSTPHAPRPTPQAPRCSRQTRDAARRTPRAPLALRAAARLGWGGSRAQSAFLVRLALAFGAGDFLAASLVASFGGSSSSLSQYTWVGDRGWAGEGARERVGERTRGLADSRTKYQGPKLTLLYSFANS